MLAKIAEELNQYFLCLCNCLQPSLFLLFHLLLNFCTQDLDRPFLPLKPRCASTEDESWLAFLKTTTYRDLPTTKLKLVSKEESPVVYHCSIHILDYFKSVI